MKRGIYIGQLAHLKGKTALLRKPPEEGFVLAKFDDMTLTRSGKPMQTFSMQDEPHGRFQTLQSMADPPCDALGFGWHVFKAAEFEATE